MKREKKNILGEKTEKPFSFCTNHSDWDLLGWQKEKELDSLLLFMWKWGEMGAAVSPKTRKDGNEVTRAVGSKTMRERDGCV